MQHVAKAVLDPPLKGYENHLFPKKQFDSGSPLP